MKRLSALLLAACLCLCAGFCAAEDVETVECEGIAGPYPWLAYELTVESVRVGPGGPMFSTGTIGSRFIKDDNRILSQIKETMVCVRLLGGDDGVAYADLTEENITQFVLRDASGEVVPLYCWSWWGVGFSSDTGFGSYDIQEGFMLFYFLPDGTDAQGLVLTVEPAAE